MPELPEVETVCSGLRAKVLNSKIIRAEVLNPNLRIPIPKNLATKILNTNILRIFRRGKYILIHLSNDQILIIHLGMSGRLVLKVGQHESLKHDHLMINLDDGHTLVFNDTRKFGLVTIEKLSNLDQNQWLKALGLEPLEKEFTAKKFYEIVCKRNKSIKSVIMDSSLIVGVGNIYACESLFSSGIHPERLGSSLSLTEAEKLHKAIVSTLKRAIKAGGSTLKDYVNAAGGQGYFQYDFWVYDREGKPCRTCAAPITRIKQNGRSSFYCGKCQAGTKPQLKKSF